MKLKPDLYAQVDSDGRLILPQKVASHYGLTSGAKVPLNEGVNSAHFRQPVTLLTKLYVEPTNKCNLTCRTCIRNIWDETLGQMSTSTFTRIIKGLNSFPSISTVLFGGFGEPLLHPDIVDMVAQAKNANTSPFFTEKDMELTATIELYSFRKLLTLIAGVPWSFRENDTSPIVLHFGQDTFFISPGSPVIENI